jgi:acyl carrier protein
MKEKILSIIKKFAKKNKINIDFVDANYGIEFKNLGIDSITVLNIIVIIEKQLGIRLDDSQLIKIKTINQLIDAFKQKTKK